MNSLEREREKLGLLQAKDLLLLPHSLSIKDQPSPSPQSTHRSILTLKYAEVELRILIIFSRPLDFYILTTSVLNLDDDDSYLETTSTLLDLVKWLIEKLRKQHVDIYLKESPLSHIPDELSRLQDANPNLHYELAVQNGKVIVLVKQKSDKQINFASLGLLLQAEHLTDTGGLYYVLKLVFKLDEDSYIAGESATMYSPELVTMLPDLNEVKVQVLKEKKTLFDIVTSSLEQLDTGLEVALAAWQFRAKILLRVMANFHGREGMLNMLDYDTMTALDLIFRTEQKCYLVTVIMGTGQHDREGKIEYRYQLLDEKQKIVNDKTDFIEEEEDFERISVKIDSWITSLVKE